MAEELQSLLDKINAEGICKAEKEAARIIDQAKAEAEAIRRKAADEAAAQKKKCEEECRTLQDRAETAVRQAARDILLELQSELNHRLERTVAAAAGEALSNEFLVELIREMAKKYAADPAAQVNVLASVKDAGKLDAMLRVALAGSFSKEPRVLPDAGISGGMEVCFQAGKPYFDFTADAAVELVGSYIGPRLAALLEQK